MELVEKTREKIKQERGEERFCFRDNLLDMAVVSKKEVDKKEEMKLYPIDRKFMKWIKETTCYDIIAIPRLMPKEE